MAEPNGIERVETDVLILGSGGAGLFDAAAPAWCRAATTWRWQCPATRSSGISWTPSSAASGCRTRISPGGWCETAVDAHARAGERGRLLLRPQPRRLLHQKAFAGQTFDRTVHKGDLTGIEIINRLMEQVWARAGHESWRNTARSRWFPDGTARRALRRADDRHAHGRCFRFVQAKAVLLATGGGPTMYRYHTPSGDKACDGMAMALRAGLALRDMEMVQFHPDRPAGRADHPHDRHRAGGGPARRRRMAARTAPASAS